MKRKPSVTYRLRFDSPWMTASAFFAGLGIFLGTLYYLCFTEGWSFGSLLLPLVLPALLLATHGVLLKGLRLDFPVVYGGLAAVYFLVALPGSTGEWGIFLWILLLLGALALTVTALGYLPTRLWPWRCCGCRWYCGWYWCWAAIFRPGRPSRRFWKRKSIWTFSPPFWIRSSWSR